MTCLPLTLVGNGATSPALLIPSFSVDGEHQLYYCFGCKAGGNVFSFYMEMEHCTFNEAVEQLAERAHMALPEMEKDVDYASSDQFQWMADKLPVQTDWIFFMAQDERFSTSLIENLRELFAKGVDRKSVV